jgi:hypothetical protein
MRKSIYLLTIPVIFTALVIAQMTVFAMPGFSQKRCFAAVKKAGVMAKG